MMNLISGIVLAVMAAVVAPGASAQGGQERIGNTVLICDTDGDCTIVNGLDLSACQYLRAASQSGVQVYLCEAQDIESE